MSEAAKKIYALIQDECSILEPSTYEDIKFSVLRFQLGMNAENETSKKVQQQLKKVINTVNKLLTLTVENDLAFELFSNTLPYDMSFDQYQKLLRSQLKILNRAKDQTAKGKGRNKSLYFLEEFVRDLVRIRAQNGLRSTITRNTSTSDKYAEGSFKGRNFDFFMASVKAAGLSEVNSYTLGNMIIQAMK